MPIVNRDYYGAAQRGRQDALDDQYARQRNALGALNVEEAKRFNALATNPQATPEQFARAGRSDIANSILNNQANQRQQQQLDATRLFQAAQYGINSQSPKAFIQQHYPEIAQLNPNFQNETDDQIRAQLQDLLGKFGPQAGIGPPGPKDLGPLESFIDPNTGRGVYGTREQAIGKTPFFKPDSERGQQPPSGYRWNGGRLEPIPGGPADPNTPNTKDDSRIFAKADKLRDEFNTQSKEFITVNDSYNQVKAVAADSSAAGDLAMIFAFMKMLDPNSVVREQEFANAQNAAGVPDRVRNAWNRALSGERLNPNQRDDFIKQADNLYKSKKGRQDAVVKRYTEIAKRNKVNPDDVVGDMSVFLTGEQQQQGAQGPVKVSTPEEAMALPSGTVFITPDGRTKVRP